MSDTEIKVGQTYLCGSKRVLIIKNVKDDIDTVYYSMIGIEVDSKGRYEAKSVGIFSSIGNPAAGNAEELRHHLKCINSMRELTLDEVADKFGLPVDNIRIKK